MASATINYGHGIARMWGDFDLQSCDQIFYKLACDCFGIRKCIEKCDITEFSKQSELPDFWGKLEGAAFVLKHGGDTVVWNSDFEKIKSEWD